MCLLEADGRMDGWVDRWMDGCFAYAGGYDALRKQRSSFVPAFFFLVLPPVSDSRRSWEIERVLFGVGKTDPILGRDKGLGATTVT